MKKMLITSFCISIITMIIGWVIINALKEPTYEGGGDPTSAPVVETTLDTERVRNRNRFFSVEFNIRKYIEYIKNNKDVESDLREDIQKYKNASFCVKEIYFLELVDDSNMFVKGVMREANFEDEYYVVLRLDYREGTFEVVRSTKEEFENARNNTVNEEYAKEHIISKNNNNIFDNKSFTDDELLEKYLNDYKFYVENDQKKSFDYLNLNYKQLKFDNDIEKYIEYLKDNKDIILNINIKNKKVTNNAGDNSYVFIDQDENCYRIIADIYGNYNITLDNKTLDNDTFSVE